MSRHAPSRCALTGSLLLASLAALGSQNGCSSDSGFSESARLAAVRAATETDGAELQRVIPDLLAVRQSEEPVLSTHWFDMPLRRIHAADYIDKALRAGGFVPTHESDQTNGVASDNIYVDIVGRARPQELVLITGHYDNWHLGADDNASAVAVLLQAARVFRDKQPLRTVRIIAFDREEEGLTGSERYAALHEHDQTTAVLNMDCVAFASHNANSQSAPPGLGLRSVGDFLGILASEPGQRQLSWVSRLAAGLPQPVDVLGLIAPGDGHNAGTAAFLRSDHAPFWRRGVPALFFTDTANFRNPNYHKATDLPETLDYDFLSRSAQLVIAAAAALAEEP